MNRRFDGALTRVGATFRAVQATLSAFLDVDPDHRAGIVSFSDTPALLVPPVPVRSSRLHQALAEAKMGTMTDLAGGLACATDTLIADLAHTSATHRSSRQNRSGRVVLVTDGAATCGPTHDLYQIVSRALAHGVVVDVIGIGRAGEVDYDERLLRGIAAATRGQFMPVDDYAAMFAAMTAGRGWSR